MRLCALVWAVFVLTAYGSVQPEPGFDPQDVVRQVRSTHSPSSILSPPSSLLPSDGEFLLDTSSSLAPAPGSQTDVVMAFDGTNFLVVWQDLRGGNYCDICGTRVTPGGAVLDPAGFAISQAAYDQQSPAIAFDGTNYLVVWQDYRRGHAYDIYGTRVTQQGAVLDAFGIIISQALNDQRYPSLAFDGTDFLVAWEDDRKGADSTDIYGARVTSSGSVLDTAGIVISHAASTQWLPVVGSDGTNALVVWQDCRYGADQSDIYGARVTPAGTVLEPQGFAVGKKLWAQATPALAFDGTNFLVVWQDINTGTPPPVIGVWGARVTPGGQVLDTLGVVIADGTGGSLPALGFDGANFLVTWSEVHGLIPAYTSIWGRRVTAAGTLPDTAAIVISPAAVRTQRAAFVGFGGSNYLVLWQDDRNKAGEPDIYGTRVTPAGEVLDPSGLLISRSARSQFSPTVGFDGSNFLAVWEDDRSGYTDIYGARVTPAGTVLDPTGFVISQATSWQNEPGLAFDGTNYLVVWQDYRNDPNDPDIYGARVTPGGAVLDPDGIVISDAAGRQYYPAIGFGGGNYLVAWQDFRSGSYDIYGTRVTPGGVVLNSDGIIVSQATGFQWNPAIGFNGTSFLAAWQDYRGGSGYADIYGTRVTVGGAVLDPNGFVITQAANDQRSPAIDFDGANALVVWEDYRTSVYPDIYGARVTTTGVVLDTAGIGIARQSKDQFAPVLAFNGTSYLVAYEDYRSSNNPDIYGAWVAPDGAVSNEGSVLRPPGNQTCLALARGSGSQLFLVYQGWTGAIGNTVYNTDRIWGKMNPTPGGGIEETPNAKLRTTNAATIVRGVLMLGAVDSRQHTADRADLLDVSGRSVMDLVPGANDVSALAPGVYFVHSSIDNRQSTMAKVVVTR